MIASITASLWKAFIMLAVVRAIQALFGIEAALKDITKSLNMIGEWGDEDGQQQETDTSGNA